MGLSFESQPMLDALRAAWGEKLTYLCRMAVLVHDISDFMTAEELAFPPEEGIPRYNRRLAGIYKSEESIGGLPMNMDHFHLFDPGHRTSRPLCLAYHAARLTDPEQAEAFLIRLRNATVLEGRPTTHREVILEIAGEAGLDTAAFKRHFLDGSARAALEEDEYAAYRLGGLHALPAYWLTFQGKTWQLPFVTDSRVLSSLISRLTGVDDPCA
ncbi:MAG: DsbA family protein [Clostridia bacterium]|nr:DsbA family protein [Clostridia bacterium]